MLPYRGMHPRNVETHTSTGGGRGRPNFGLWGMGAIDAADNSLNLFLKGVGRSPGVRVTDSNAIDLASYPANVI